MSYFDEGEEDYPFHRELCRSHVRNVARSCKDGLYCWSLCNLDSSVERPTGHDDWFRSALKVLLTSEKYSDMAITCGTQRWNVHRAIVCTFSPFFAAALGGDWKEAQDKTVDLPNHAPWMVDRLLDFIYTGKYSTYAHTTKADGDLDADKKYCSPILTRDQLLHGLDQTNLPAAFDSPDISERITSWGHPDRVLIPDRIREGLWISLQMYLLGDLCGLERLCMFAAARFHEFGSLFSEPTCANERNKRMQYSLAFVKWVGRILVSFIDPLYSTLPPVTRRKGLLHRKLCHLLMRYLKVEDNRAQIVPMLQKHPDFAEDYMKHVGHFASLGKLTDDEQHLLMSEASVDHHLLFWELANIST